MHGKLVWVCHNLVSHKENRPLLSKLSRHFYLHQSDFIIVHLKEAAEKLHHGSVKVHYFPHPAYAVKSTSLEEKKTENIHVLIWGNILPYKGIKEFIQCYSQVNASFKVVVVGRGENSYIEELQRAARGLNIEIRNEFLQDDELQTHFNNSKIILLPYSKDITTSGALIHSLHSKKIIIGPATGNFNDLYQLNSCLIYHNYKELFFLLERLISDTAFYEEKLSQVQQGMSEYIFANTWDNFIDKFLTTIE